MVNKLDPEIFGGPGYVMTVDNETSIALCGGWEMSVTCRRGPSVGERHASRVDLDAYGFNRFGCEACDMPLLPIGPRIVEYELMSVEPHVIEELPW